MATEIHEGGPLMLNSHRGQPSDTFTAQASTILVYACRSVMFLVHTRYTSRNWQTNRLQQCRQYKHQLMFAGAAFAHWRSMSWRARRRRRFGLSPTARGFRVFRKKLVTQRYQLLHLMHEQTQM
jgi:hypothetical protein